MAGPVGILGPIVFLGGLGTTSTFSEITKKRSNSFAKHSIINGVDLLEDTGEKPIELNLQMRFFSPYTASPSISLIAIEALADSKTPVPLIINGCPVGRGILTLFVIEEITSKMVKFVGSELTILDITCKLCEYSNPISLSGPLSALAQVGESVIGSII
jgi:phage protein U